MTARLGTTAPSAQSYELINYSCLHAVHEIAPSGETHQPFRLIPIGSASFLIDLRRPIRHSSSIAAPATATAFLLVSLSKMPRGCNEGSQTLSRGLAPTHFRSRLTTLRQRGSPERLDEWFGLLATFEQKALVWKGDLNQAPIPGQHASPDRRSESTL